MARHLAPWTFIFGFFCFLLVSQQATANCQCPDLSCNPCEDQAGLTFYSQKCVDGAGIMSCKRPTCVQKDPLPKSCAHLSKKTAPTVHLPASQPTAAPHDGPVRRTVGKIVRAQGRSWVIRESGEKMAAKANLTIIEMDTIETGDNGKVQLVLANPRDKEKSNVVVIVPNSQVRMDLHNQSEDGSVDKTLIKLMYGKIRSMVNQNYKGTPNHTYEVRTKTAVAGVRGTDFVTSYYEGANTTKVETLQGMVELQNSKKTRKVEVVAGSYASYIVEAGSVLDDSDIRKYSDRGHFTSVERMPKDHVKRLEAVTDFAPIDESVLASSGNEEMICQSPSGGFNDCSWTCVGNINGDSECRVESEGVRCVRRRCNANGNWAEETWLGPSEKNFCEGRKTVVRPCEYD